jgi:hypothetical protein
MHNLRFGEICELSYHQASGPFLPHLVRDLNDRLQAFGLQAVSLSWDCDDIAVFDLPGHRIILAKADQPSTGVRGKLLISVGPAAFSADTSDDDQMTGLTHSALCRRIVRAVERKHPACRRSNRSWPGVLTPERTDDLLYAGQPQPVPMPSNHRATTGPLCAIIQAKEKRLRTALGQLKTMRQRQTMAAGLLINGLTWSMIAATPAVVMLVFGTSVLSTLVWASKA